MTLEIATLLVIVLKTVYGDAFAQGVKPGEYEAGKYELVFWWLGEVTQVRNVSGACSIFSRKIKEDRLTEINLRQELLILSVLMGIQRGAEKNPAQTLKDGWYTKAELAELERVSPYNPGYIDRLFDEEGTSSYLD